MIKETFIFRIVLLLIAGVMLILAFSKMAKKNPVVQPGRRNRLLKILGCILALLGMASSIAGIFWATQIDYPLTPIEPLLSANSMVRPSSQTLYWGYPTLQQRFCISMISDGFMLLSLASYCIFFKVSATIWWKKILKVFFSIILVLIFMSSTDFHYFDFVEWIVPFIYAIMFYFVMKTSNENDMDWEISQETDGEIREPSQIVNDNKEDVLRFMPQNNVVMDKEEMSSLQETNEITMEERVPANPTEAITPVIVKEEKIKGINIDDKEGKTAMNEKVWNFLARVKGMMCNLSVSEQLDNHDENVDDGIFFIWNYHVSKPTKIIIIVVLLLTLVDLFLIYEEWRLLEYYSKTVFRANIIILMIELIAMFFIMLLYKLLVRRKVWYYTVLKTFCLIVFVLCWVIAAFVQIDNYEDYEYAKEEYKKAQILRSDDTEQKEQLFEEFVDSDIVLWSPDTHDELVDTMHSMAYKDNSLAQGTLAKIYFSYAVSINLPDFQSSDRYKDCLKEKVSYLERGFYWAMKAAEKGDKRGTYFAGVYYAGICKELEIKKDFKLAAKYWNIAAEQGYGMAYYRLGQLYGTWELFDGVIIADSGEKYACDIDHEDNAKMIGYPLPDDWRHDLKKARQYWHKALQYGGKAAEKSKIAIEKVYDEEVSSNKMKE